MTQSHTQKWLIALVLLLCAAVSISPILLSLVNSFKTIGEIFASVTSLPSKFHFENYTEAFSRIHMIRSTFNTLIVSFIGIGGIVVAGALAGYKLSRTGGKLSGFMFLLFVSAMLVPFHAIMIPLTQISMDLSLHGHIVGLGLICIGLSVNMGVFLYHGFVKSIPRELEEAAYMDGYGEFRTFFGIIFPLLLPITVTLGIIMFLWIWNDFLLPMLMLTDKNQYTIVLSTNVLFGEYVNEWNLILAALIIAVIPVVILYAFFQRYIIQGLTSGAVKG